MAASCTPFKSTHDHAQTVLTHYQCIFSYLFTKVGRPLVGYVPGGPMQGLGMVLYLDDGLGAVEMHTSRDLTTIWKGRGTHFHEGEKFLK